MSDLGAAGPMEPGAEMATAPGLGPETDPRADRLRACLREGLASAGDLRAELGLPAGAEDAEVARALALAVGAGEVGRVAVAPHRRLDPRPSIRPSLVPGGDASFLGRLRVERSTGAFDIGDLEDVRTLVAVVRAGSLRQRRGAVRRLGALLGETRGGLSGEHRRLATEVLGRLRDVEVAYELSEARLHVPGALGRRVRGEREEMGSLAAELAAEVAAFWDGEGAEEPVSRLPGEQRASLLMRVRDLPDELVHHLAAVIEGADGVSTRDERFLMISSLRHANDPRLVAALRGVVETGDTAIALEAARALGRIDDPRVHPALVAAYERSVVDRQRTVLAGVLALAGDTRGLEYVRSVLGSDDPEVVRSALEALEAFGSTEDTETVVRRMEQSGPVLAIQAVRTLGRIADGRALPALREMRERTSVSALWAELEDAEAAIRARMELRGEEMEVEAALVVGRPSSLPARADVPARVKLRAFRHYLVAQLWLMLGAVRRAVARLEVAAEERPGWAPPLVSIAMAYGREDRFAQALAAFRRAIEVDRARVERNPVVIRMLASCFLRRAEEVDRDGRVDIARGLLEEALSLDLRRAPSALRFEVGRRHEAMRSRLGAGEDP